MITETVRCSARASRVPTAISNSLGLLRAQQLCLASPMPTLLERLPDPVTQDGGDVAREPNGSGDAPAGKQPGRVPWAPQAKGESYRPGPQVPGGVGVLLRPRLGERLERPEALGTLRGARKVASQPVRHEEW